MAYIKDLDKYLTKKTGLTSEERDEWRKTIAKLLDKKKGDEALRVLNSPQYWKTKYKK